MKKIMPLKSLLTAPTLLAVTALAGSAEAKPVRIHLLSGQSNMTGRGNLGDLNKPAADQKATLVRFIMDAQNVEKYKFLYQDVGRKGLGWKVRDDVFITLGDWPHEGKKDQDKHGGLGPGYGGFRDKGFGPELGIGHALGNFHNEPVLLGRWRSALIICRKSSRAIRRKPVMKLPDSSGTRARMTAPPGFRRSMNRTSRISSGICARNSTHPA